jgi:hypothetical protein
MTTYKPAPETAPVCPECGKAETYMGTQKFPKRSYYLFHCMDATCELFERTHSIEIDEAIPANAE